MPNGDAERPSLTGAERGKLRSLAQTIEPKVFVGKAGVNEGIAKLLKDAFRNADLVKVRFSADRDEMGAQATELARLTDSEMIGSVGRASPARSGRTPDRVRGTSYRWTIASNSLRPPSAGMDSAG